MATRSDRTDGGTGRRGAYGAPSLVEIALAALGLAAWFWCACEVVSAMVG